MSENGTAVIMLSGSYGATAVLLYDSHYSPLAQPRNVFGMNITKTVHPPAGAVAFTAIIGGLVVINMGFGFVATSA
eukprot:gene32055-39597_t